MSEPMVIHISKSRYELLKGQSYGLKADSTQLKVEASDEAEFHLLDGERDFCDSCGMIAESVRVDTPTDLERVKYRLRREAA